MPRDFVATVALADPSPSSALEMALLLRVCGGVWRLSIR